jgi:Carboxylesterase family
MPASTGAKYALLSAALGALLSGAAPSVATAQGACNAACLNKAMDQFLDSMIQDRPGSVAVAANAIVRENTAPVKLGDGVWNVAKAVKGRQDFPDPVSQNIWSFVGVELDSGEVAQMSVRLKLAGGRVTEAETIVNTGNAEGSSYRGGPYLKENVLEPDVLFTAPVPKARQSSREDLIKIANGYFEALGMLDPGAAKFGVRCVRFESGAGGGVTVPNPNGRRGGGPGPAAAAPVGVADPGSPAAAAAAAALAAPHLQDGYFGRYSNCSNGLAGRIGQQTIERRFPVAIPELGIVIGYMFITHRERIPPTDNFINEIFKVVDGKIRQIDAVGWQATAPLRSGYAPDFPHHGIIRGLPAPQIAVAPVPPRAGGPQLVAGMPKPPYPGISEARNLHYGPDPKHVLDILYPTAKSAAKRPVVVFVHGGGWQGGDKRAPGDDIYENVPLWAAKQGMIGVNINYRLANYANAKYLYPSQEQDVAAAVDWVGAEISNYGGDPNRIFLWGHSSGGSIVARYASDPKLYGTDPIAKGIFMLSSPLDMTIDERSPRGGVPYYGKTHEEYVANSALTTLVNSKIPVLLGYSRDETGLVPEHFEVTKKALCDAGRCPDTVLTKGSHQGEMMAVGTDDTLATDALLAFMKKVK